MLIIPEGRSFTSTLHQNPEITQEGFHLADFNKNSYMEFFLKFVDSPIFWLISDKNSRHCT
jgi:hypothetical protein